jgi:hypothetical protein
MGASLTTKMTPRAQVTIGDRYHHQVQYQGHARSLSRLPQPDAWLRGEPLQAKGSEELIALPQHKKPFTCSEELC